MQPTVVRAGDILSYASTIWQRNLLLLVGVCFVQIILIMVVQIGTEFLKGMVLVAGERELFYATAFFTYLVNLVWQTFLNIGVAVICLKLARQERADFGDLFGGAKALGPVLGLNVLLFVVLFAVTFCAVILAALAGRDIGPAILMGYFGVLLVGWIIGLLCLWPVWPLLVDNRASLSGSFKSAARITAGNRVTTFLLWLLSFGIVVAGVMVVIIGLLFAIPLVWMIWAVAYLMMSGQIPNHPPLQSNYR